MPTPNRQAADVRETRSKSFNGSRVVAASEIMGRRMTDPGVMMKGGDRARTKLTKVLMNVTVEGGVGAVQVLMNPESTVGELIEMSLKQYVKERRRLPVTVVNSSSVDDFDLHFSQFSLQCLNKKEKLATLGSRNFFMCRRRDVVDGGLNDGDMTALTCSKEADKVAKLGGSPSPWFKFINFLL